MNARLHTVPSFCRACLGLLLATMVGAMEVKAQSLAELYSAALSHDSGLQVARAQLEANRAKAEQAWAALWPQANLSAGTQWSTNQSSAAEAVRSSNSQNVSLTASQALYRPVNFHNNSQAQLGLEQAKAQVQWLEQDLMLRVAQAYVDVLVAQDSLRVIRAQKSAVTEQLQAARRGFEVGTTNITDTLESQARADLTLAQEIASGADLQLKQAALEQMVGRSTVVPRALNTAVDMLAPQPEDLPHWIKQALSRHPLLRQAQNALEVAELEMRKAQTAHLPTLDLVGQYQSSRGPGTNSLPSASNVRNKNASVGLQLNLPLYAGGAVQGRIKEAQALSLKAGAEKESAERNVTSSVRAAFLGLVAGISQARALEAAESSSQSALEANMLGYQVGARINIDVLNAQSQLFQTQRDLAVARYNMLLGQMRLKMASGQLRTDDLPGESGQEALAAACDCQAQRCAVLPHCPEAAQPFLLRLTRTLMRASTISASVSCRARGFSSSNTPITHLDRGQKKMKSDICHAG